MKKTIAVLTVTSSMVAAAFVAGIAVGKTTVQPKFVAAEELKWEDLNGAKFAQITGDYKKGPHSGLLKIPAGFTSPLHSHTGAYEAIQISGTSSHWLKGEDGTKAKKMTPGSYYSMPGKLDHVSACASGTECVSYVWQKVRFDFVLAKDATGSNAGSAKGSGAGSGAKGSGAGSGSAAKGAGSGSGAKGSGAGSGSAAKGSAAKGGLGF